MAILDYSIIGERFGRLTVIDYDHMGKGGNSYWLCKCDCGNNTVVSKCHLKDGHTRSCGCYSIELSTERLLSIPRVRTSDEYKRIYRIWHGMIDRCENHNNLYHGSYGGRGIYVCEEWHDFKTFYDWAINSGYDDDLTIDRIDNNDGYYPDNCRWADRVTQLNNTRRNRYLTYCGVRHSFSEWSRILNVPRSSLQYRIRHGQMFNFEEYFGEVDDDWFEG